MEIPGSWDDLLAYVGKFEKDALIRNAFVCYLTQNGYDACGEFPTEELRKLFEQRRYHEFAADAQYFAAAVSDIKENLGRYVDVYGLLSDAASRETLFRILNARLFLDPSSLSMALHPQQSQYFLSDMWTFLPGEVYVDCGAYNGDSVWDYMRANPAYAQIHAFEPAPSALRDAKQSLRAVSGDGSIAWYPYILGDVRKQSAISDDRAEGNRVTESGGGIPAEQRRLDDVIDDPVSCIKIDVEGCESQVLLGAEQIITRDRPRLAVCVYHKVSDLWELPLLIRRMCPTYALTLRQYRQFEFFDTILFCTPRQPVCVKAPPDTETVLNRVAALRDRLSVFQPEEEAWRSGIYGSMMELKRYGNVTDVQIRCLEAKVTEQSVHIRTLEDAFSQRNTDVSVLESALQQRNTDVSVLENALQQRNTDVSVLESALQQRNTDVSVLENALQQRNTDVSVLESALQQRNTDVSVLENALQQRNTDVSVLENALQQLNTETAALQDALRKKNEAYAVLERTHTRHENDMDKLMKRWPYRPLLRLQCRFAPLALAEWMRAKIEGGSER